MQDKKNYLTIGEASEYLGVSIDTLRRWERKGRIEPFRSPGGHRYYEKGDLDALFGKRYIRLEPTATHTKSEEPVVSNEPKTEEPPILTPPIDEKLDVQELESPQTINEGNDTEIHTSPTTQTNVEPPKIEPVPESIPPMEAPPYIPMGSLTSISNQFSAKIAEPVSQEPKKLEIPEVSAVQITRKEETVTVITQNEVPREVENPQPVVEEIASPKPVVVESIEPKVDTHPVMNQRQDFLLPQVSLAKPNIQEPLHHPESRIKTRSNTKERLQIGVIVTILILVVILAIILFVMLMRSSQNVLSPSP